MSRLRTFVSLSAASALGVAGLVGMASPAHAATISLTVDCLNGLANYATPTVVTVHPGDVISVTGDAANPCTRAGTGLPGASTWLSDWPGAPAVVDTADVAGAQPFTWTVRADAPIGLTGALFAVGALGDAFNPPSSNYFALDIVAAPVVVAGDGDDDATEASEAGEHAVESEPAEAEHHDSGVAEEHDSDVAEHHDSVANVEQSADDVPDATRAHHRHHHHRS